MEIRKPYKSSSEQREESTFYCTTSAELHDEQTRYYKLNISTKFRKPVQLSRIVPQNIKYNHQRTADLHSRHKIY